MYVIQSAKNFLSGKALPNEPPKGGCEEYSSWLSWRVSICSEKKAEKIKKVIDFAKIVLAFIALTHGVTDLWKGYVKLSQTNQPLVDVVKGVVLTIFSYYLVTFFGREVKVGLPQGITNLSESMRRKAQDYFTVIPQNDVLEELLTVLSQEENNNVILIGPTGVGKTSIIEYLTGAINSQEVWLPEVLRERTVYKIDLNSLVAGKEYRGSLEQNLEEIKQFINEHKKDGLFWMDEIQQLGIAKNREQGIPNVLKEVINHGVRWIGATTFEEYQESIVPDKALKRRYKKIYVKPMNDENTLELIEKVKDKRFVKKYNIQITSDQIKNIIDLCKKNDVANPHNSIDTLHSVFGYARRRLEKNSGENERVITAQDIAKAVAQLNQHPNDS